MGRPTFPYLVTEGLPVIPEKNRARSNDPALLSSYYLNETRPETWGTRAGADVELEQLPKSSYTILTKAFSSVVATLFNYLFEVLQS